MRVICDRCGGVQGNGMPETRCGAQLKVPGIGFKTCDGKLLPWIAGGVPGISNERGVYDAQCEAVFASLNTPRLVLLCVLDGPKGNGFSVAGHPLAVASLPPILRDIAVKIERSLSREAS